MKTLIVLTTLGIAVTAISLNASDALLSPRAQDNQVKTVAATDSRPSTVTQSQNLMVTPRQLDNQSQSVTGTGDSHGTLAGACATGSPKQLEQAGKTSSATCCKVAATCSTPKSCCGVASK
jgi:hypothetical protein